MLDEQQVDRSVVVLVDSKDASTVAHSAADWAVDWVVAKAAHSAALTAVQLVVSSDVIEVATMVAWKAAMSVVV